jgi:hypothetical protein
MSELAWALIALVVIATALLLATRLFWRRREQETGPHPRVLDPGWQFYSRPTTLEPPGTVFRIDDEGRRFLVGELEVEVARGREASGRSDETVATTLGIVARFLGIDAGAMLGGKRVQRIRFELLEPEHETTTDMAIEGAVDALGARLRYRADNRYFVVRAVRCAAGMTYRLSDEQVDELGGEASLEHVAEERAEVSFRRRRAYELDQRFPEVMRVMFLAEEIKPISAGLAGEMPELGVQPVTEVLEWKDAEPE